ncbi:regulatory particle non-ATPase 13 isoform 2-T2 [Aphomia sociella]
MSATALFGNTSGLGGSSGGNKHLVEFRAGRMTLKGRMVHPDKRKGLLYVYQGEDSLMHFCWKDRTTGEVEDDLLIFPDDCEFVRVNECTTGRVYVLKFKSFSKKYFFWLQEPKTDKDDEYCRRINEALNNPPTSGGRGGSGGGAQDGEIQNFFNNMSQQQLMQLFGGVGQIGNLSSFLGSVGNNSSNSGNSSSGNTSTRPSAGSGGSSRGGSAPRTTESTARTPLRTRDVPAPTATPPNTANAGPPRSGQIFLSDLQRYFSGLGNAPEGEGGAGAAAAAGAAAGAAGAGAGAAAPRVDLAAALATPEAVAAATAPANAQRLTPHLPPAPPEGTQDDAANQFSSALTSGQMGPVMSQFGLSPEVVSAANTGDMQAFFKALENTTNASNSSKSNEGNEKKKDDKSKDDKNNKKDGDAGMSLD